MTWSLCVLRAQLPPLSSLLRHTFLLSTSKHSMLILSGAFCASSFYPCKELDYHCPSGLGLNTTSSFSLRCFYRSSSARDTVDNREMPQPTCCQRSMSCVFQSPAEITRNISGKSQWPTCLLSKLIKVGYLLCG